MIIGALAQLLNQKKGTMEGEVVNLLQRLEALLEEVPKTIQGIDEELFTNKPLPDKWSKLEILGHLCDSAAINHQRFIKIILADQPVTLEGYKQNELVKIHDYQNGYTKAELLELWKQRNKQIRIIVRNLNELELSKSSLWTDGSQVTLKWLLEHYLDHLDHHLKQIVGI
ncbi:DinB family protein [Fontibacillus phaseoli]|uniref:DinB family protein n=1 Tax=Fontibacillus phaseoli TaxID=1416533 RepID=A0A369BNP2_9BACL|nr:DinB family protein [Fontibacillus phaseoli]RCX22705.1 DinB family protein [Fontibacillus phaseoli]